MIPSFTPIRSWFRTKAILVYYWLLKQAVWKSVRLTQISLSLMNAEIRMVDVSLLQIGEDENIDDIVEYVARRLSGRAVSEELEKAIQKSSHEAVELLNKVSSVTEVKEAVQAYHLADAFLAGFSSDKVREAKSIEAATAIGGATKPYDSPMVYQEVGRLTQRLRQVQRVLSERSAIKFTVSIANISSLFGVISVVFVASGFLYTRYFFAQFGLDVSLFFTLSDYLAASIEQIRIGAFSALASLMSLAVGLRTGSMRSRLEIRAMATSRRRERLAIGLLTIAIIVLVVWGLYVGQPNFDLMRVGGFLCAYWMADFLAERFFTEKLAAMVLITGLIVFASNVGVSAYQRANELLTGKASSDPKVEVVFKSPVDERLGPLVGANSGYVFMMTRDRNSVFAIPRDRVDFMKVRKPN